MPVDPACTPPRRVDARPELAWPLYDTAASREIERAALAARPPHQLMARAGLAVARLALSLAEPGRVFWVAAGPGNNGGDGLVAATWLHRWGQRVQVSLCARADRLPDDAAWALRRAEAAGVAITWLDPMADAGPCPVLPAGSWIIDALLGLGSRTTPGREAAVAPGTPLEPDEPSGPAKPTEPSDPTATRPAANTADRSPDAAGAAHRPAGHRDTPSSEHDARPPHTGRGPALHQLIDHIHRLRQTHGCRVLAIDLPSGLDADRGQPQSPPADDRATAVVADHTLSLLTLKPGLCTGDGPHHAGVLWWHGLGVMATPEGESPHRDGRAADLASCRTSRGTAAPRAVASGPARDDSAVTVDEAVRRPDPPDPSPGVPAPASPALPTATALPAAWRLPAPRWAARESHRHKGSYGDVLVLGGADGMAGAVRLAADAALQAGGGRVWIGRPVDDAPAIAEPGAAAPAPRSHLALPQALPPELMQAPIALLCTAERLARATVVCGCGGGAAIARWLPEVLRHARRLVLDADALNALAVDATLRAALHARVRSGGRSGFSRWPTLLTPHPLEAARLLGCAVGTVQDDRLRAARELARAYASVVLLKGSGTVLAAPDGTTWVNPRGSARLATPGSGDVLAGWIGGTWSACGEAGARSLWHRVDDALPGTSDGPLAEGDTPTAASLPHPGADPTLAVAAACAWLHGAAGEAPPHGLPLRAGDLALAMARCSTPASGGTSGGTSG